MSSLIECEIICAYACLTHSECVRREGVFFKILNVRLHTYSISDAPSAEICATKRLYGEDTVCGFVYAGACVSRPWFGSLYVNRVTRISYVCAHMCVCKWVCKLLRGSICVKTVLGVCVCASVTELQVCDKRQKIRRERRGFKSSHSAVNLLISPPWEQASVQWNSAHYKTSNQGVERGNRSINNQSKHPCSYKFYKLWSFY